MSMSIPDPTPTRETLTQRTRRLARESEIRGNPKSKADLAREEKAKREAALAKSIIDAEAERSSKGLRMMKMMGFTPGSGLGRKRKVEGEEDEGVGEGVGTTWKPEGARLEPVGVAVKEDRSGIGHAAETARRVREAGGGAAGEVREADPAEYRERVRVEREEKRLAAQLYAAQKVCEKMDMARDHGVAEADIGKAREIPLTSINVLWRGMVRQRERRERERRARYDMEQSLGQPRLPGYDRLHELDEVDKVALGIEPAVLGEKGKIFVEDEEEDEDEDEELNAFEESPVGERLDRIVRYLREEFK